MSFEGGDNSLPKARRHWTQIPYSKDGGGGFMTWAPERRPVESRITVRLHLPGPLLDVLGQCSAILSTCGARPCGLRAVSKGPRMPKGVGREANARRMPGGTLERRATGAGNRSLHLSHAHVHQLPFGRSARFVAEALPLPGVYLGQKYHRVQTPLCSLDL